MPERMSKRPSPALRARSVELRREQTPTEQILWQRLRGGKEGTKFRRQHVVGQFIADFCSLEHHLIVEVDGPVHQQQIERDAERTIMLEAMGYRVMRFTNEQVLHKTAEVLAQIRDALTSLAPAVAGVHGDALTPPAPSPTAVGEGERGDAALTPPAPAPTAVSEGERGDAALTPPAPSPTAVGEGERGPKVLRRSSVF